MNKLIFSGKQTMLSYRKNYAKYAESKIGTDLLCECKFQIKLGISGIASWSLTFPLESLTISKHNCNQNVLT